MKPILKTLLGFAGLVLLGLVPLAGAHGQDGEGGMNMDMSMDMDMDVTSTVAAFASYFQHSEHSGLIFAHILLMTVGWIFVLPIAVMLSISRSRYGLPVQATFLVANVIGVMLVTIYNANTPDLYPNNAHHKIGWILTWVICAQTVMAIARKYARREENKQAEEQTAFIPICAESMAEHERIHGLARVQGNRFSGDSGQGTERNTESLRSQSISSAGSDDHDLSNVRVAYEAEDNEVEKLCLLTPSKLDRFLSKKIPALLSSRALGIFHFAYNFIDRVILPLGFLVLTTGIITYGGLFMGSEVYSGLAHFIKGGVFFWYGILTLARWAGCFADIGWAWNIKPSKARSGTRKGMRPSAEFVESSLIFIYGATNVFLEHLAAWGDKWSAQDLEHISITIMFIGGGLCGILIESRQVRNLLNVGIRQAPQSYLPYNPDDQEAAEQPKSYSFSMNPLPALIVLLLGLMMSSHHQASMVSTMIHKQWGTLLVGGALARGITYLIFYLSPPTSIFPGRPPSELITAFCLMAGGLIFMASSKDTIAAIELYNLDAMFVFNISTGLITFLMAWTILVIAIKGWALRKERGPSKYQTMA